jgi:hypothetical protein
VPGYMPMGADGMGMMGEMEMPGPDNTLPMMTGDGQFGPIEMDGCSRQSKYAKAFRAATSRTPAGTSILTVPLRTKSRSMSSRSRFGYLPWIRTGKQTCARSSPARCPV